MEALTRLSVPARNYLGVIVKDLPRYLPALRGPGDAWLAICNRGEALEPAPHGSGFRCCWEWTSDLHAPKLVPSLGLRLMQRALTAHPVRSAAAPEPAQGAPQVSFLIGHRGAARLPQLLATLGTIAAQEGAAIECIVVEQDERPCGRLPGWVRTVHTPPPDSQMPYCRSWAFNVAARHARAPILVLHDNDMMVPADYAATICARVENGFEVVNLKRFIFYLSAEHSALAQQDLAGLDHYAPACVTQNLEGGGSIAITREAFDAIGGMDESFVGWGGEDNEFWERVATRTVWHWASLPLVHLYHAAQQGKHDTANATAAHYRALSAQSPQARAARLRSLAQGQPGGPHGWKAGGAA